MFRTLLFIPGNNKKFLLKSKSLFPDILCYDLEDSVPDNEKSIARKLLVDTLSEFGSKEFNYSNNSKKPLVYIRINSFESNLYDSDLNSIINTGLDGIVVPKVNNKIELDKIISIINNLEEKRNLEKNTIKIIPSIESAEGVINVYNISCANDRIQAIVFGVFDYLYDMQLDYDETDDTSYNYARSKIPVAAKSAGIYAIDSIWQTINDLDGLKRDTEVARRLGYSGKSIIHPSHIDPVHSIFVPTNSQIKWAKRILEVAELEKISGSNKGAIKVDGKMVDAVHFKQAKFIINSLNSID
ncbi:MAG: HpcH/HpaI aldolase/citrate lyase family protein [Nitrososphaeraceae archaeon]